jgi:hypothetical protein
VHGVQKQQKGEQTRLDLIEFNFIEV